MEWSGAVKMKNTIWEEINFNECEILNVRNFNDEIICIEVKHPKLKRSRWFQKSRRGNFYSRYTKSQIDTFAEGFILKNIGYEKLFKQFQLTVNPL